MRCAACGHDNRETAAFCEACGARLAPVCSGCANELRAGARFCDGCGQVVAAAVVPPRVAPTASSPPPPMRSSAGDAALEGERKQVTILFADVVGSTALIQGRDDEEAQRLLDGAVQRMVDAVHRYGGTVSRRMGDGLMAMFGAPVAYEDHAVRASFAALAMLEAARAYADEARAAHGAAIQIRVGLNSGGVIVRLISNDQHLDYTAMGETVHLASRMEQMAAPDTVLLSPSTRALVEGFVEVRGLGVKEVRGFAQPVDVYGLVGGGAARSRLQAVAGRGLTPFVGRDDERAAIDRALARAQAGQGQLVALVAEAGVGKSRLVWEATRSELASATRVLQTGAVSYGQTTTWLPVIDLLRAYFHIDSRDDHAVMREKVGAGLRALDPALEPAQSALLSLLDVPIEDAAWTQLDPSQRRRATHVAVQQLLLRESQRQPLLLVFEDLHWIDSETQTLLDGLVELLPTAHIVLLVNYRPEYTHTWGSKTYYTQIRLDPLGDHGAGALLDALLGSDPTVQPLTSLLIQRTVGTPLFLEESVRALVETGALAGERGAYRLTRPVADIRVPATVQTVLAARIDRLPAEEKRLLQMGAVIGKDVPFVLLRGIAERPEAELQASLSRLQAAEMLYPTTLFPQLELTFKHALTHDVAYGSLLQERRKQLHARIVAAIEAEYGDRLDEHVERLAQHAFRGQLWNKAAAYYRQAGGRAMGRSAIEEAVAHLEQALVALGHLPRSVEAVEQTIDLRLELRNAIFTIQDFPRALEQVQEAEALARTIGDKPRIGFAIAYRAGHLRYTVNHRQAIEAGLAALALARELGSLDLWLAAVNPLTSSLHETGEYDRAIALLRETLTMLEAVEVHDRRREYQFPAVTTLCVLSWCLSWQGKFSEAIAHVEHSLRIAESGDHPQSKISANLQGGLVYLLRGDIERSIAHVERLFVISREVSFRVPLHAASAFLGHAYAYAGRPGEAIPLLESSLQIAEEYGFRPCTSYWTSWLAGAYLQVGRIEDAWREAERAVEMGRDHHERGFEGFSLCQLGDVIAADESADTVQAERAYLHALAIAEELGMRPLQAHCHLGLGTLYRRMGRLDEARAELAEAVAMFSEMGMAFWLPEAESELAAVVG